MESSGENVNFVQLAKFTQDTRFEDVPDDVLMQAKLTLLHNLTVALMASEHVGIATRFAEKSAGGEKESARLWSSGTSTTIERAVLANSAMMHARTQDDSHLPAQAHFGSTSIAAILAKADQLNASGSEFLMALILAYEVGARAAGLMAPSVTKRGFRATTVFGPLACAAGVARISGLSASETVSALALASSFGGGSTQTWLTGTSEWLYQVGIAGVHGLWATELAKAGANGAPNGFEGSAGVVSLFSGASEFVPSASTNWAVQDVSYKPYPICAICQTPVITAFHLREHNSFDLANIEAITIQLHPNQAAYPGTDARGPFVDVGGSLMSAPFCVGVALLKGHIGLDDIEDFENPSVLKLAAMTTVVGSEECNLSDCRITVVLKDGTSIKEEVLVTPEMFTWNREETLRQVAPRQPETRLNPAQFEHLTQLVLNVEKHTARELVEALIASD